MNAFWTISILMAVAAVGHAEYIDFDDKVLDEEMVKALGKDTEEAKQECAAIQAMSMGTKNRANIKDKLKGLCNCDSYKDCKCCAAKDINCPLVGSFTFGVCTHLGIDTATKVFNFTVTLGPWKVLTKLVSYANAEDICKKVEKFKHVEFCMKTEVTEKDDKSLRACFTLQCNILDIFNKPLYFPCLNFDGKKLKMDDNMDDYKDDGIRVNLKGLWNKFKNLFSKNKNKP